MTDTLETIAPAPGCTLCPEPLGESLAALAVPGAGVYPICARCAADIAQEEGRTDG